MNLNVKVETTNYGECCERLIIADKIAAERAARAGGWNIQEQPVTLTAFWAWQVMKRTKRIPESLTYEDFLKNELIDAIVEEAPNPTQQGDTQSS